MQHPVFELAGSSMPDPEWAGDPDKDIKRHLSPYPSPPTLLHWIQISSTPNRAPLNIVTKKLPRSSWIGTSP